MNSYVNVRIVNEEVYKQFIQSRSFPEHSHQRFDTALKQQLLLPNLAAPADIWVPEDWAPGTMRFRLLEYQRSDQTIFATLEYLRFEE